MSVYSQFNTMPTNPRALEVITSTQNWAPRASGWVNFVAVGGGGGATGGYNLYDNGGTAYSTVTGKGGGAGGLAIKSVYVTKGQSYTITVGAGGSGGTNGGTANAGGATTVVGPGVSMTVTGGNAGSPNANSNGGTLVNTANATYDFFATGGGANGYGGGAVALYSNTTIATANTGQGAGPGSNLGYGFVPAIGANATTKVPGISAEGTALAVNNAAVAAQNCGGSGLQNYASGNSYMVATAGPSGAFAGGSQAYAEGYLYVYGAVAVSNGGVAGRGAGGGAPYSSINTDYGSYQAYVLAQGSAGGAGCVIVEYL